MLSAIRRSFSLTIASSLTVFCLSPALAQTQALPNSAPQTETLRNIRSVTASKIVVMPVTDASGQGSALAEFATEVINQSVRLGGISTVPWFKVNKELKKVLAGSPDDDDSIAGAIRYQMMMSRGGEGLTSDENMNELIIAGKKLGARYIIRPVILKQSNNTEYKTSINPFGAMFGIGAAASTKRQDNAEVDVKVDIVSIAEEDFIAQKTFSGRSAQVTKDRANRLDGITGMQVFSGASEMDQLKVAFYDTIDKIVELLQDKTQ